MHIEIQLVPLSNRFIQAHDYQNDIPLLKHFSVSGFPLSDYAAPFSACGSVSSKPVRRIAYVRLSPQGKSYAMQCDRKDLSVDDEVEVLMYAGTDRAYYDNGVITDIAHQRWDCSCQVVNHINEVKYTFDASGFTREVNESQRRTQAPDTWRDQKAPYLRLVSVSTRFDRSGLLEADASREDE